MTNTSSTHEYPITGIVIANEWDAFGNITGVAIYADNEKIYFVGKNKYMKDLLDAIQEKVKVEGEIIQLAGGHEHIDIKSLQVIKTTGDRINVP
jgi:hypothetical protein